MKNNPIFKTIDVTDEAQPLAAARLVGKVCISCPPGNAHNVTFAGPGAGESIWIPGEWHDFEAVDLNSITVVGTAGDHVKIDGETT